MGSKRGTKGAENEIPKSNASKAYKVWEEIPHSTPADYEPRKRREITYRDSGSSPGGKRI